MILATYAVRKENDIVEEMTSIPQIRAIGNLCCRKNFTYSDVETSDVVWSQKENHIEGSIFDKEIK